MKTMRILVAVVISALCIDASAQVPPPPPRPKINLKAPPRPPARRAPARPGKLHIKLPKVKLPPPPPAPPRPF